MSARRSLLALALAAVASLAAACNPSGKTPVKLPGATAAGPFDRAKLEAAIEKSFGGVGTCVEILDAKSGAEVYRYNTNGVCQNPLPPCSTFDIPNSLIALDAGAVTPTTVLKWDGTPQTVTSWQHDSDLKGAFKESIIWWYQKAAAKVGQQAYAERLKDFGYGNRVISGPITSFWLGPQYGGQLGVSTRGQAEFLQRLYAGRLNLKPESQALVEQLMVDEIRGEATMSGKTGSCATLSDSSRQVGWWVGRLKTAKNDWVFAASMDASAENSLPGIEIQERVKSAFADAGLWPAA